MGRLPQAAVPVAAAVSVTVTAQHGLMFSELETRLIMLVLRLQLIMRIVSRLCHAKVTLAIVTCGRGSLPSRL